MTKNLLLHSMIALFLTSFGCGGGSGSISSTVSTTITTVADLPSSTSAVEDGGSTSSALIKELGSSSVGMPLGSITSSDFSSSSSLAACQMFNQTKTAINQAAQGDLIQCYITSTFDAFATAQNIDIYDGEYHVFALDFTGSSFEDEDGEGGGPSKIKFKITRNSDNVITGFEMFSCGDSGSSDTQGMYLNQTISGTDFSMSNVNIGSHGTTTFSDAATVTGTLNSSGQFVDEVDGSATPKVIRMQHAGVDNTNGFDFWADMTFNQSSDSATMTGTMSGSNTHNNTSCTFTDVISASAAMIDGNASDASTYNIGLLELGDGALKGDVSGSCGSDTWTHTFTEAWSGATGAEVTDTSSSTHYAAVTDDTLTAASQPTISFGDNTWDCSEEAEATVVFASLSVDVSESCSNLQLNHNHIDCWHTVGDGSDDSSNDDSSNNDNNSNNNNNDPTQLSGTYSGGSMSGAGCQGSAPTSYAVTINSSNAITVAPAGSNLSFTGTFSGSSNFDVSTTGYTCSVNSNSLVNSQHLDMTCTTNAGSCTFSDYAKGS